MVVQIKIKDKFIRLINAYGPQENEAHEKIIKFYSTLDQIVQNAKLDGCLTLLEFDANAKVGNIIIKNDPHPLSSNGSILIDFVERNNLVICNSTEKCQGLITRRRITNQRTEESIIDYLILCEDMYAYLESMVIDQVNVHTRYIKKKNNDIKTVPSDHFPIFGKFNIKWNSKQNLRSQRRTIFNFKNKEGLRKFKQLTSEKFLSSSFQNGNILEESRLWLKNLKTILYKSFPTIRLSKNQHLDSVHEKMVQKSELRHKVEDLKKLLGNTKEHKMSEILKTQSEIEQLDEEITKIIAEKNANKIKEHYNGLTESGSFNVTKMWHLKKKILPLKNYQPTAKKDPSGNLVTNRKALLTLYKQEYIRRLASKPPPPPIS